MNVRETFLGFYEHSRSKQTKLYKGLKMILSVNLMRRIIAIFHGVAPCFEAKPNIV